MGTMLGVIADSDPALSRARRIGEIAGAEIAFAERLGDGPVALEQAISADAVFVDLQAGDAIDAALLCEAIRGDADAGRYRAVIAVSVAMLDNAEHALYESDAELLCAPDDIDCIAAVSRALASRAKCVRDRTSDERNRELLRLSDEIRRIGESLEALSGSGQVGLPGTPGLQSPARDYRSETPTKPIDAHALRDIIRIRRERSRLFEGELFADPAWDILLDLMAARLEGREVAVSSLCIAAAVPPTTALRWIKSMTQSGLLVRMKDPEDGRRVFIELSNEAAAAVERWYGFAASLNPFE